MTNTRKIFVALGIIATVLLALYVAGFFRGERDISPGPQPTIRGTQ